MSKTRNEDSLEKAIGALNDIEGGLYEVGNLVEVIGAAPDSSVTLSDGAIRGAATIADQQLQRLAESVAAVRRSLQSQAVQS